MAVPISPLESVAVSLKEYVPVAGAVNDALAVFWFAMVPTEAPVNWVHAYALMLRPTEAVTTPDSDTVMFGATTCDGLVIVTIGGTPSTCMAAWASRMPAPQSPMPLDVHHEPAGKGRADDCKMDLICAGLNVGLIDKRSAATPATCGAALLVPAPIK